MSLLKEMHIKQVGPFRKLVLEDDGLVQCQNKDVFYRMEATTNKENPL